MLPVNPEAVRGVLCRSVPTAQKETLRSPRASSAGCTGRPSSGSGCARRHYSTTGDRIVIENSGAGCSLETARPFRSYLLSLTRIG